MLPNSLKQSPLEAVLDFIIEHDGTEGNYICV